MVLQVFLVQWELMEHLVLKAPQDLQVLLVLQACLDLQDLKDLRVVLDPQELEVNRVIQEFQVSKEKLAQKGNQGHMALRGQ